MDEDLTNLRSRVGPRDVFQLFRGGRSRTRAEVAALTGLPRSTVNLRLETLVHAGLIGADGTAASTGGRPSTRLRLRTDARLILAIDVGVQHVTVALTDLTGHPVSRVTQDWDVETGPHAILAWCTDTARDLITELGRSAEEVLAIGVGLPGPVDFPTGRPLSPEIMPGWEDFDIARELSSQWPCPVAIDNDVNVSALGEREAARPDDNDLVYVKVASGIGAGVFAGGRLQRGAKGMAGDIGHISVTTAAPLPCSCGKVGCLSSVASGIALTRRLAAQGLPVANAAEVAHEAAYGNAEAAHAVREAGRAVGEVLASYVSILNPSAIVVGGSLAHGGDHLLVGIREALYARSLPLATADLTIVLSSLGADAALRGISALALDHALDSTRS